MNYFTTILKLTMPFTGKGQYKSFSSVFNRIALKTFATLVLLFALVGNGWGQAAMSNYAGANYSATSGSFTVLVGSTNVSSLLTDDAISTAVPIGFDFWYMGVRYTDVYASANGFLSFNSSASSSTSNNLSTGTARPLVAPFWDDLSGANTTGGPSKASYLTSGSVGSRVFTFEWLNWQRTGASSTTGAGISFQAKLYEANGRVEFVYRNDATGLAGTTQFLSVYLQHQPVPEILYH